ncbi:eukaryotic translation initiation factor 3 subunit M-like protein [Leptotrombidium deliense]|uniref:Eukaryotic translation initiation factor 3 subunit M n=1 Tax=Leptotrombidium deliense TaxID=299467 RepID=A0A443SSL0_9ACAR|nr:eukaryotic translation initiation factor 3 subunit M-like protein [Leptotrombidium deliense]
MVPTFIDLGEQEQCEELREYFSNLGANISKTTAGEGFLKDVEQIIGVCEYCFKEEKENDIECVLNSVVSLLIQVPQTEPICHQLINSFCEKLLSVNKSGQVCLRVLQNLFEGIENNYLRYDVYVTLVKIASQTNQIHLVYGDMNKLKQWFNSSTVGIDKVQCLLRLLHEVLIHDKQSELALKVMIELLSTYTEENASKARLDAHRCIVSCVADPNTFLMDHLLALKPVKFLEGELIHDLLTIFVAEKLSAYIRFCEQHKNFVDSLGLSHEQNLHKMRLLTFMQLAETKKELSFESIQEELQLQDGEVEAFVIEILRTRMVRAKIDQLNRRVLVTSTMHRTFGKQQWLQLRDTLSKWQQSLAHVHHTVASAVRAHYENMSQIGPLGT